MEYISGSNQERDFKTSGLDNFESQVQNYYTLNCMTLSLIANKSPWCKNVILRLNISIFNQNVTDIFTVNYNNLMIFDVVLTVNSSLPVHLTSSNVQQNLEFAKLLTSLTRHLTDSGMSLAVHKDMTQVCVTDK